MTLINGNVNNPEDMMSLETSITRNEDKVVSIFPQARELQAAA